MTASKPSIIGGPGWHRATLVALALLPAGCGGEDRSAAQAPPAPASPSSTPAPATPPPTAPPAAAPATPAPPPAPAKPAAPLSDLESLVAPIALYPDPLLAELLVASTYPLEVVQAARWLESKPDLATIKDKGWDASIQRLADVPQVLKMMNEHLDWTTRLGDAFLAQPDVLMNTVQDLRRRARQSGFLKDTPEQKVSVKTEPVRAAAPSAETPAAQPAVVKKEVVYIEPAKPDTLYVPQYNPEQAYSAPLAPPPATTAAYPAAAPASNYYPAYYPTTATTTTTTDSTNQWLTFGAGALVGGLLTWGIMEWADNDDDWHGGYYGGYGGYYPPVSHYYGGAVCRNGNCWNGGGGNWDRGNVNYNKNVNVSGNEVNIDRSRTINQSQLASWKQERQGWVPDARHRRGQQFPEATRERLGKIEQPGLAGDRLGAAQTLPANVRGFGQAGAGAGAGMGLNRPSTLPAERRPSSDEVRKRLSQDTKLEEKFGGKLDQNRRPKTGDVERRLEQGDRANAWEGLKDGGREARAEERRGTASREQRRAEQRPETRDRQKPERRPAETPRFERPEAAGGKRDFAQNRESQRRPETQERKERAKPQGGERNPNRDFSQAREQQKRTEHARPNAFEGARDQGRTQDFSQRGAASRQQMGGNRGGGGGGGGKFQGGGGGGGGNRFQGGGGGGGGGRFQGGGGGGGGPRGRR
jgi:hypothetical protein